MDRFCANCGQKLADNSDFCANCGTKVTIQQQQPQQQQYQQAPQQNFGQQPQQGYGQGNFNQNNNSNMNPQVKSKNSLAMALSIVGLVLGIIGSMMFGIFLSLPSLAAGIIGVIMGIDVKKKSNNTIGQGAFVIGILAIVFSSIFTIGCSAMEGYGCYGCVGGACKVTNEIDDIYDDIYDDYSDFFD